MSRAASDLLLTPLFIGALGTWAFNDHVLKRVAPGALSGKLGDAAAMIAFPILLAATLSPLTRLSSLSARRVMDVCAVATAVLFTATKLSTAAAAVYQVTLGAAQFAVGWASVLGPAAHTMDPTDALVTPLVVLPMLAIRGRLLVRLGTAPLALGLLMVMLSGCGVATPRGVWRGDVTVRAHGGLTENSQFDQHDSTLPVSGPDQRVGTHRAGVVGASADASMRVGRRAVVGATVSVATGSVSDVDDDYQRFGAYTKRYGVVALGPTFGLYGRRYLIRGGVTLTVAAAGGQGVGSPGVMPLAYLRVEPGRPERVHLVLQVGSADGFTWDGRVLAAGLSIPHARGHVAFGYSWGTRVGPDLHGTGVGALAFAHRRFAPFESYGWLELLVSVGDRASLVFGVQGGRQLPVASLGLRWELDAVRRVPPEGAVYHWVPLPPAR